MRKEERIDPTLERLGKVWKQYPDLRLGQLILNVARDPMLYYLEDEELIKTLEEFYGITDISSKEINKEE